MLSRLIGGKEIVIDRDQVLLKNIRAGSGREFLEHLGWIILLREPYEFQLELPHPGLREGFFWQVWLLMSRTYKEVAH